MGFFDLPAPAFSFVNSLLAGFLPPAGQLIVWGLVGSSLSMSLYVLLSPQRRLTRLKGEIARARKEMSDYQGDDFSMVKKLAGRQISLSFKQVCLTVGPALAGALPVIFILVWVSNVFSLGLPADGKVKLTFTPPNAAIESVSAGRPAHEAGVWWVDWPALKGNLRVKEAAGREAAVLDAKAYVSQVHKRQWWNLFLGNPAGYVQDSSGIESIRLTFKNKEYLNFGPDWLRGWEALLIFSLVVFSLLIKFIFKIH